MNEVFSRLQRFSNNNPDELLGLSLAYIGEILQKSADKEIFRPEKISIVNYNILSSLSIKSPRTASSIAPVIIGSPANFSAILTRMEKEDLIIRKNSEEGDKREVFVHWTTKGEAIFKKIHPQFQNFFTEKFKYISDTDKKDMTDMIQKIF